MAWISGVVSVPLSFVTKASSNIGCCRLSITPQSLQQPHCLSVPTSCGDPTPYGKVVERRKVLVSSVGILVAGFWWNASMEGVSVAAEFTDMPALRGKDYGKTKMRYPDYTETESGLQYKDLRVGNGPIPKMGETVVVDWDGYTIGYYGRIFEARNKTKGGSFVGDDKDFFKFRIGSQEVIPAFEEAVSGMALGGIRSFLLTLSTKLVLQDHSAAGSGISRQ
ncbi:peptidyl-prolyl cis-trans isomerase FKBP19, chloroplastic isoform X2 [Castanea sativa]|uniref:peptidyl-prolyl cis-trans isomerase FKBP19, chloroplastic isoform X2 n=1 Tax=Castanea sativa TaxID=21020 RepID=UPI003F64ADE7